MRDIKRIKSYFRSSEYRGFLSITVNEKCLSEGRFICDVIYFTWRENTAKIMSSEKNLFNLSIKLTISSSLWTLQPTGCIPNVCDILNVTCVFLCTNVTTRK